MAALVVSPSSQASTGQLPPGTGAAPRLRLPSRFRRRLLLVLLAAGLGPLLAWGLAGRSLLEAALAVAPPVGPLLGRAAEALGRGPEADPALQMELRQAELRLAQADLARERLTERVVPLSFALALGLSAALVLLASWLLGRRLSRPVEALADAIGHYARGDLQHQAPVSRRGDELDYLAVELNRMGRELSAQRDRLAVSEALAAWRDAARALAHDLRNPLTAMRMALGRLNRERPSAEAIVESVSLLQEELEVLIRMAGSFAEFARQPDPRREPVQLGALVEEVAALYRELHPQLQLRVEARPLIVGDADQLRRALGNLVKNALEAQGAGQQGAGQQGAQQGPQLQPVEVELVPGDAPSWVKVAIRDHGPGVDRVMEGGELMRGLKSSKPGGQRGLGLPIAHKVIHEHGGRLKLCPAQDGGTLAVVELPAGPTTMPTASETATSTGRQT